MGGSKSGDPGTRMGGRCAGHSNKKMQMYRVQVHLLMDSVVVSLAMCICMATHCVQQTIVMHGRERSNSPPKGACAAMLVPPHRARCPKASSPVSPRGALFQCLTC